MTQPTTKPERGSVWERHHSNGWRCLVIYHGEGNYSYSFGLAGPDATLRGSSHIHSSLQEMQELVDGRVPSHTCLCGPWMALGS